MELHKLALLEKFNPAQTEIAASIIGKTGKITRKDLVEAVNKEYITFTAIENEATKDLKPKPEDIHKDTDEDNPPSVELESFTGRTVNFNTKTLIATYGDGQTESTNLDALRNDGFSEVVRYKVGDEVETASGEAVIKEVRSSTVIVLTKPSSDFPNQTIEYRKEAIQKV